MLLGALANSPQATVFVTSSKPASQLVDLFGSEPKIGLSAEHSMKIRIPGGEDFVTLPHDDMRASAYFASALLPQITEKVTSPKLVPKDTKHEFSRIFSSKKRLSPKDAADLEAIVKEFESENGSEHYLQTSLIDKVDTDGKRKQQLTVTSTLRGKHKLSEVLMRSRRWTMGIAVGDKDADAEMLSQMASAGFIAVLVGERSSAAERADFFHLDGPDDVWYLIGVLTAVRENRRGIAAARTMLEQYAPHLL